MNKKEKGFTLIELLGVIVIIGLLALLVLPIVNNIIYKNREKLFNDQVKHLEKIAYNWSVSNLNLLSRDQDYILTFSKLIEEGYLKDTDVTNPLTDTPLEGCILVSWDDSSKQYLYEYDENCEVTRAPIINISYTSITINMGDTYDFPEVTATLNDNSTVVLERPIIKKNALIVSTIDTSILNAVYELIYTVTDSSTGRSSSKTVTLTVADKTNREHSSNGEPI